MSEDKLHDAFEAFEAQASKNPSSQPDSLLTSAWRGRVLAVITGGLSTWVAGTALLEHLVAGNALSADTLKHADAVLGTGEALVIAVLGLAAAISAGLSKLRERQK